jgi:hypothetical protein
MASPSSDGEEASQGTSQMQAIVDELMKIQSQDMNKCCSDMLLTISKGRKDNPTVLFWMGLNWNDLKTVAQVGEALDRTNLLSKMGRLLLYLQEANLVAQFTREVERRHPDDSGDQIKRAVSRELREKVPIYAQKPILSFQLHRMFLRRIKSIVTIMGPGSLVFPEFWQLTLIRRLNAKEVEEMEKALKRMVGNQIPFPSKILNTLQINSL